MTDTTFEQVPDARGRLLAVPSTLPRLPVEKALAVATLPLHLAWSGRRTYDLADRGDRARVYEAVLQEGRPEDVLAFVDGVLLVDIWPELVLPSSVRQAWGPVLAARR